MARFDEVHNFVKIPDNLRPGEPFHFVLEEPNSHSSSNHHIVAVKIENNRLVPFSDNDKRLIDDWKMRHKNTPLHEFFPLGIFVP